MTNDGLSLILKAADGSPWQADILALMDAPGRQSLKAWLTGKSTVETLQVTVSDGRVVRAWAPGPRTVDTSRASYARFGESGSRRDYAGVVATASTDTLWAGLDTDMHTHLIYRVVTN